MTSHPLNSNEQAKIIIFVLLMVPLVIFIVGIIPAIFLASGVFLTKKNKDFEHIKTAVRNFQIYCLLPLIGCLLAAVYFSTQLKEAQDSASIAANSIAAKAKSDGYSIPAHELASDLRQMGPNDLRFKYGSDLARYMMSESLREAEKEAAVVARNSQVKESIYSLRFPPVIFAAYLFFVKFLFLNPLLRHSLWVEQNSIFSSTQKNIASKTNYREIDIIKGAKLKQYSVADELTKWAKLKEDGHISEDEFNDARNKLLNRD